MDEKSGFKTYIGDSVYVKFDGYHIVLTTENGYPDDPRNLICLEPPVYDSLLRWVEMVKKYYAEKKEAPDGMA